MDLSVAVIAPTGRDSELITAVLNQYGVFAHAATVRAFLQDSADGLALGPILIAEEALTSAVVDDLASFISKQPSWSDLPILILTGNGRETLKSSRLQAERMPLGSPILLERPIRTATLVSSVQAALRARARQYEIKAAVSELKEERALLEAMLDNLPVGVILTKASGEVVRGNRRLDEIVRHPLIPSPDLESHSEWPAFHADGRRVLAAEYPLTRAIKSGRPQSPEEYLYERGDGTKAWVSIAASPILDECGEVAGGVVAFSDIDRQKRSELALIQNEKLAAVGRLAASISHEINNPLEAVTNLIYLSRHSEDIPPNVKGYLENADQELARVSQIVSHTLRFHRQSTNPSSLTPQELLAPTLGLFAGRIANSRIELVVEHRVSDLITCFEGEIRQVLNNLVGNAIDSMKHGGRLRIRTRRSRLWKQDVGGVRFSVGDTGSGVPSSVLQHIFEAFFTTKGINGTGLGLWISKGIVEKHSGDIRVRSNATTPNTGTVFSLFLQFDPF